MCLHLDIHHFLRSITLTVYNTCREQDTSWQKEKEAYCSNKAVLHYKNSGLLPGNKFQSIYGILQDNSYRSIPMPSNYPTSPVLPGCQRMKPLPLSDCHIRWQSFRWELYADIFSSISLAMFQCAVNQCG